MMAFPIIIAVIVCISIAGYTISALGAVGSFEDPHDWSDDGEEE